MIYIVKREIRSIKYSKVLLRTNCKQKAYDMLNRKNNMWSMNSCATFLKKYPELPNYTLWLA